MKPWLLALSLAACGADASRSAEAVPTDKIAALKALADKCGLPRETLELTQDDELLVKPPPTPDRSKLSCLLEGLKRLPYSSTMGFLGNEAYDWNKQ